MNVKAYELETTYKFVCTQDDFVKEYEFPKQPPEEVELANYLKDCKANSIGLAEWELAQLQAIQQQPEEPKELDI